MKPGLLIDRYFLKFGLDRDPFPPNFSQDRLFLTHELNELMGDLLDTIKEQEQVLVVESAAGGGKSSLANYLNYLKESNWYLSLINATPELGVTELAHTIISQHFPRHRFDKTQSAVLLEEFLQLYQRNGKIPVVIIDDAHLLSQETLSFILKISGLRYEGDRFRFILFAEKDLRIQLERPSVKQNHAVACVYRDIPALSRPQTMKYIEHRLALAGECKLEVFDDLVVDRLFEESSGIPGEINKLARQHMKKVVIPGRARKIMLRSATAMAACLMMSVALYAGMTFDNERQPEAGALKIAIQLPAGSDMSTIDEAASPSPSVANKATQKKVPGKQARPVSKQNREVLLADRQRQNLQRQRKIEQERARREMRTQIAALDSLALRVSDVLQN